MQAIVYSFFKLLTPLLVLLAQVNSGEIDLEQERLRMFNGTEHALVTLIARHADGSLARGTIACQGLWFKYQDKKDEQAWDWALPFKTDSRGAIIMNPHLEDGSMDCTAIDSHLHTGRAQFALEPLTTVHITVR